MGAEQGCPYDVTYEIGRKVIRVRCGQCDRLGSHHDSRCRAGILNALAKEGGAQEIILEREREYYFDEKDTRLIAEFASVWARANELVKRVPSRGRGECVGCLGGRSEEVTTFMDQLLYDWAFGHRTLMKIVEGGKSRNSPKRCTDCQSEYLELLEKIASELAQTKMVKTTAHAPEDELRIGTVYDRILTLRWHPFFMRGTMELEISSDAVLEEVYEIPPVRWKIYRDPEQVGYLLDVDAPEIELNYLESDILRSVQEHMRKGEVEAMLRAKEPRHAINFLRDLARRLITEEIRARKLKFSPETVEKLSEIFGVYFGDLGVIRRLIDCPGVTTVQVISPPEATTVKVEHVSYGICETGINVHTAELLRYLARIRYFTKRPISKSQPFLDCDYMGLRISASCHPAIPQPDTLGMTIAKPRTKPWTQPLFIYYKQLNPLASALVSVILSSGRGASMAIIGPPGSGKTSTLESYLMECPTNWVYSLTQDVREIHTSELQPLGYIIIEHTVRPDLLDESETSLEPRARESAIAQARRRPYVFVLNEARSETLYKVLSQLQSMSGTLTMSTLFARSVEDLWRTLRWAWGVPPDQFKQFDLVVQLAGFQPLRAGPQVRRVIEVVEIGKDFVENPIEEKAFIRLMKYDPKLDTLLPTPKFIRGNKNLVKKLCSSDWSKLDVLKIANRLSLGDSDLLKRCAEGARMTPRELLLNILINAKIKSDLLKRSRLTENPDLLEYEPVFRSYRRWNCVLMSQEHLFGKRDLAAAHAEFSKLGAKDE